MKFIDSYKNAILNGFKPTQDTLLLEAEVDYSSKEIKYENFYLTSLKSNMKINFDTGNVIEDFKNALLKGRELISTGEFNSINFDNSYNTFSNGIFISSSCDDFISDSEIYQYVIEEDASGKVNVIGIKKITI